MAEGGVLMLLWGRKLRTTTASNGLLAVALRADGAQLADPLATRPN